MPWSVGGGKMARGDADKACKLSIILLMTMTMMMGEGGHINFLDFFGSDSHQNKGK